MALIYSYLLNFTSINYSPNYN